MCFSSTAWGRRRRTGSTRSSPRSRAGSGSCRSRRPKSAATVAELLQGDHAGAAHAPAAEAGGDPQYGTCFRTIGRSLYTYNFAPDPERQANPHGQLPPVGSADRQASNAISRRRTRARCRNKPSPPSPRTSSTTSSRTPSCTPGPTARRSFVPSVQGALCKVTGGTWHADSRTCAPGDYHDPTVIITHSLGGYILMDSIQAELRARRRAAARRKRFWRTRRSST